MASSVLRFRDCLPYQGQLSASDERWLSSLEMALGGADLAISMGGSSREPEPVVYLDNGRWHAGRYIGMVRHEGRTLAIEPRLGIPVIERWLEHALNLLASPRTGRPETNPDALIPRLLARIWCSSLDQAARHGPPALRRDSITVGEFVRGNIDVRTTARHRARGHRLVAATTRHRSLDNDVARALVVAARTLDQQIGSASWQTDRAREILPACRGAVGARPAVPSQRDLRRVRFSPITLPYRSLAELSIRIAHGAAGVASSDSGTVDGILIDVAELWELFLLASVRRAVGTSFEVDHEATSAEASHLLHSVDGTASLGRIKPDIVVRRGSEVVALLDAKYKSLTPNARRPSGVDRGDLYQLSAYVTRHDARGPVVGALLYPREDMGDESPPAERRGPWANASGSALHFRRIPLEPELAVGEMEMLLSVPVPAR